MKRYTQPVMQNVAWPDDFTLTEVPLIETPNGKWVHFEEVATLERNAARYEWIRANQSTAAYLLLNNMMAEAGDILDAKVDRARGAKDGGATPG